MESIWTLLWAYEIFENAKNELEAHRKPWCTLVVHPSVVAYDYRIAWTWEEMDKRNKSNALKDKIRLACWMPWRPYWKPLFSQWTDHWGKHHYLNKIWNFWSWKTDLIPDWW